MQMLLAATTLISPVILAFYGFQCLMVTIFRHLLWTCMTCESLFQGFLWSEWKRLVGSTVVLKIVFNESEQSSTTLQSILFLKTQMHWGHCTFFVILHVILSSSIQRKGFIIPLVCSSETFLFWGRRKVWTEDKKTCGKKNWRYDELSWTKCVITLQKRRKSNRPISSL